MPYGSGYGSSKAAVVRFTESLAGEVAEYGIKVYALGPGLVLTDMTLHKLESEAGRRWLPRVRQSVDEGRHVPPERAAHLAVFLASSAADGLSGRVVSVHDDVEALARRAAEIEANDLYTLRLRK